MRPLLLLDVDGPLNPFAGKPERRPDGYTTHRMVLDGWTEQHPLRVWLNPDHGRMLTDLAVECGLDLVWATTWQHLANTMIAPLVGLPELPVIEFGDALGTAAWKWDAVTTYAGDRPLAWLDDDFHQWRHGRPKFDMARLGRPTLLHTVDARIGITYNDLSAVAEWALTLPSDAPAPQAPSPDAPDDTDQTDMSRLAALGTDEEWVGILQDLNGELAETGRMARD